MTWNRSEIESLLNIAQIDLVKISIKLSFNNLLQIRVFRHFCKHYCRSDNGADQNSNDQDNNGNYSHPGNFISGGKVGKNEKANG